MILTVLITHLNTINQEIPVIQHPVRPHCEWHFNHETFRLKARGTMCQRGYLSLLQAKYQFSNLWCDVFVMCSFRGAGTVGGCVIFGLSIGKCIQNYFGLCSLDRSKNGEVCGSKIISIIWKNKDVYSKVILFVLVLFVLICIIVFITSSTLTTLYHKISNVNAEIYEYSALKKYSYPVNIFTFCRITMIVGKLNQNDRWFSKF